MMDVGVPMYSIYFGLIFIRMLCVLFRSMIHLITSRSAEVVGKDFPYHLSTCCLKCFGTSPSGDAYNSIYV